jgi:hypothetical protein
VLFGITPQKTERLKKARPHAGLFESSTNNSPIIESVFL